MKQSHECPSCRTRVLPEGHTVDLVEEEDEEEEVNNSNWDSVGIPSGRLPPGAMTATTHFLQYGTEPANDRSDLFPSFLPMEQRRTFLEDLLIVGVSEQLSLTLGRFELILTLIFRFDSTDSCRRLSVNQSPPWKYLFSTTLQQKSFRLYPVGCALGTGL